jgi:hypothetical protein
MPSDDKAASAAEEREIKIGKQTIPMPSDGDWVKATKDNLGLGFTCNPISVPVRGDNPAALKTRVTPVHDYKVTDTGAGSGEARTEITNRLARQNKR